MGICSYTLINPCTEQYGHELKSLERKLAKSRDPRIVEQRRIEQKATISEILMQNQVTILRS